MPPPAAARALIDRLDLAPLPGEGGYFRQTWKNATASAIYFLITAEDFSALHRLTQDELWHHYAGDPVDHVQIAAAGAVTRQRLGPQVLAGEVPQLLVPAGSWQGARLARADQGFSLLGCVVSPPWEESGGQLADRSELLRQFPAHAELIRAFTR